MAKNYQRQSKGGRFRRADIGDAGIRSYREQQRTIIDAIKLQQAQDKDISRDQLSGMQNVAAKCKDGLDSFWTNDGMTNIESKRPMIG